MADLKPVYKAETVKAAEIALDTLAFEKWGTRIPNVSLNHGVKNGPICRSTSNIQLTFVACG